MAWQPEEKEEEEHEQLAQRCCTHCLPGKRILPLCNSQLCLGVLAKAKVGANNCGLIWLLTLTACSCLLGRAPLLSFSIPFFAGGNC